MSKETFFDKNPTNKEEFLAQIVKTAEEIFASQQANTQSNIKSYADALKLCKEIVEKNKFLQREGELKEFGALNNNDNNNSLLLDNLMDIKRKAEYISEKASALEERFNNKKPKIEENKITARLSTEKTVINLEDNYNAQTITPFGISSNSTENNSNNNSTTQENKQQSKEDTTLFETVFAQLTLDKNEIGFDIKSKLENMTALIIKRAEDTVEGKLYYDGEKKDSPNLELDPIVAKNIVITYSKPFNATFSISSDTNTLTLVKEARTGIHILGATTVLAEPAIAFGKLGQINNLSLNELDKQVSELATTSLIIKPSSLQMNTSQILMLTETKQPVSRV